MPKVDEIPEKLRPYLFHKVALTNNGEDAEAVGECPYCLGPRFYISPTSGMYSCKNASCVGPDNKSGGNVYGFIRHLHSVSSATREELEEIALERKIAVETLQRWGLVKSAIDGEWMLPGYGDKGQINNLYRWTPMKQSDGSYKRRLLTTSTLSHCLFGFQFWDSKKPNVMVLEGPWDAMALEEAWMLHKRSGGKTLKPPVLPITDSMYATTNIVAVPGCDTFKENWIDHFKNKEVTLMYDSDHKRAICKCKKSYSVIEHDKCPKCGSTEITKYTLGAGYKGMESAAKKLRPVAATINILSWGEEGYVENQKDGFDIGDVNRLETTLAK